MKKITIFILAFVINQVAFAQIEDAGTELLKPFRAKLADSKKFNANPILPKLDTQSVKNQNYVVPTHLKELIYPAPKITPLGMYSSKDGADKSLMSSFYAKAGFGYPITPLVELSYHTKNNQNYKFGATFRHHSGQGLFNKNQKYSETGAGINGAYFFKNGLAIGGGLGFNMDAVRFYGYGKDVDTITINSDSIKQRFTEINGNLAAFNGKVNKLDLNYKVGLKFHNLTDKFNAKEFSITPEARVEKWFGSGNKRHLLATDVGMNYVSFKDTITTDSNANRLLVYFHPTFTYNAGIFKARVGANLGTSEKKFYVFPDIEANLNLWSGKINIYAGWSGEVKQNNFRTLTRYNPFIVSNLTMHHTKQQDFYGGVRGTIKKFNYDAKVMYSIAQNLPLFLNDSLSNYQRFSVLFDTANIFGVRGALDWQIIQGLTLGTNVQFNIYSLKHLEKAFHLPALEANFTLGYQWKKLQAKADFFVKSGVPYFDYINRKNAVLQGLFDFNLGASYFFTKNIAAFVDINNILNNQNQRWFGYKQIGFNVMGGIIVKL